MSEQALVKTFQLTRVGTRAVSAHGFRVDLVRQHLQDHLTQDDKWCRVGCMARTMCGRNTPFNCKAVRKRAGAWFRSLLERYGDFMLVEYEHAGRGRIMAMKLYEAGDGLERQTAAVQLDRMERRKQVAGELLLRARSIVAQEIIPGL